MTRLFAKPALLASIALVAVTTPALAQNTLDNETTVDTTLDNEVAVNTTTTTTATPGADPMLNDPMADPGLTADPLAADNMAMNDIGMVEQDDDDDFPWGLLGLLGLAGLLGLKRRDDDVHIDRVDRVDTRRDVPPAM